MRFPRQLLAAATVMVSTTVIFAGCTSRSASEESDLAEPDIAVVPDVDPGPPRGEIRLVDGLLSSKRLPAGGFRALIDLLGHREKSRSRLYDRAIKELVKVACEYDDPLVSAVIDGSALAEIYPLDRLHDADAAGCGFFSVNGRKQRGALFDNGCFATRLAVVTAAFANGDDTPQTFDKCPISTNEPRKSKPANPPPATMGSAVATPLTGPMTSGSGAGQGSGVPAGVGSGDGSSAVPRSGSAASAPLSTGTNASSGSGSGSSVAPKLIPPASVGSAVAPTRGS